MLIFRERLEYEWRVFTLLRIFNAFSGHVLDILARKPLWDCGLNYPHGTGHGVGAFLNVHEGKLNAQA